LEKIEPAVKGSRVNQVSSPDCQDRWPTNEGEMNMFVQDMVIGAALVVMIPGLASAQAPSGSFASRQGYNQRLGVVNDFGSYYRFYTPTGKARWHAYQGDPSFQTQFNNYNLRYNLRQLWNPPTFTPMPLPLAPPSNGIRSTFPYLGSYRGGSLYYDENAPRR
jgi:hypothetical protein